MDHDQLAALTQIYDWIERDMGMSESDFYADAIRSDEFDNSTRILKKYKMIVEISNFKLTRIDEAMRRVNWPVAL